MMVAWYWLILAFCVGIAFATITDECVNGKTL